MVVGIPHRSALPEGDEVVSALGTHGQTVPGAAAMDSIERAVFAHATNGKATQAGTAIAGPARIVAPLLSRAPNRAIGPLGLLGGMSRTIARLDNHRTARAKTIMLHGGGIRIMTERSGSASPPDAAGPAFIDSR